MCLCSWCSFFVVTFFVSGQSLRDDERPTFSGPSSKPSSSRDRDFKRSKCVQFSSLVFVSLCE